MKLLKLLQNYFTLGWLDAISGAIGIGSGVRSMFGGPDTSTDPTDPWGNTNRVFNPNNSAYQKLLGIDPSAFLNAANTAGGQYGNNANYAGQFGNQLQNNAQGAYGNAGNLINAGNALWNTVQNPQSGLYNQMFQNTQDTANAGTSMRGIGMSPEAAGIQNQAANNFNNSWNNNFIQNQATGLQGMDQAYGAAGQQYQLGNADLAGAMGMYGQQAGNTLQSGQVPYQAQQQAYGAPLDYSNMFTGAMNNAFNKNAFGAGGGASGGGGLGSIMNGLGSLGDASGAGSWLSSLFGSGTGGAAAGGTSALSDALMFA